METKTYKDKLKEKFEKKFVCEAIDFSDLDSEMMPTLGKKVWDFITESVIPLAEKKGIEDNEIDFTERLEVAVKEAQKNILTELLEMAKNEPDELTNELKKNIDKLLK